MAVLLRAGLPLPVACTAISKVCGSALKAVMVAHDNILAGSYEIGVAGGQESMTNAPYLLPKARGGYRLGHGQIIDHMFMDGLEDAYSKENRGRLMGSFALADWRTIAVSGVGIMVSLCPVLLMRWRLNIISMGEDEAKFLGVNVNRDRLIFVVSSTLAVSLAVSVSGIIGWVGLMVPHLVRMMIGPDHRTLVPLSMAAGATFMIFADTVARSLAGYDIPVGIVTALSGAPFFVYLMKRGGKESWGR